MMKNIINIHKEAGTKKDAVRVRRESDIPDLLTVDKMCSPNKPNRLIDFTTEVVVYDKD